MGEMWPRVYKKKTAGVSNGDLKAGASWVGARVGDEAGAVSLLSFNDKE